ncbi:hypothetical protein FC789_12880 [Clostridium botulinum]|nr:hypothetical protein [Clostridium botulinum]
MVDREHFKLDNGMWGIIENNKKYFKSELIKEVNKNHILYGIEVKEIARREDCDDILFLLLDGSDRYAIVHLTWSGKREDIKNYPRTRLYNNIEELIKEENY